MVSPLNVKPYESAVTLDTLLTALSSIGAMVPAGGAAINEMAKRSDLSTVVDAINATQQQFQYQPRFDQTYGNLQAIAENPLISALAESQQAFGDMLYENTGSPLAGALGQVSLDALDLLDAVPSTAIFAGLRSLDNLGDAAVMTSHGSKTASQLRHDFSRAEELADSGIDPWQETGWFKGADGNWRYEIDDSDALFSFDNVRPRKDLYGQRVGLLPEGLSHNELYKAYPDLLNVSLHETQSPSYLGTHGNMFGDEYIGINSSQAPMPNKDQRSTALHESMHAIQDREGYARGGNLSQMESMERPLSPEWKAWNDMQADPLHHEYMRLLDDPARHKEIATMNADYHENVRPKMDEIDRKMKDVYSDSSLDALQKRDAIGALLDEQKAILDSHNSANSGKYPLDERITQVAKELRGKYGDAYGRSTPPERQIDAREAYRRLSGEVEARNVQSRRNLSLEDRRNLHPYQTMDYILEDQIVNPQTLELGRQHISGERLDESYITPLKRNGEALK